jgi:hypothetical protein
MINGTKWYFLPFFDTNLMIKGSVGAEVLEWEVIINIWDVT